MPSRKSVEEREAAAAAKAASAAAIAAATGGGQLEKFEDDVEPTLKLKQVKPSTVKKKTSLKPKVTEDQKVQEIGVDETVPDPALPVNPYGENYYLIRKEALPSSGKFYNNDIYLRNFKVLEIKQLATTNDKTSEKVVNRILKGLIKGVDYENILSDDKIAIMFYIRVNTFPDPNYKVQFECTNFLTQYDEAGEEIYKNGEVYKKQCKHPGGLHFTAADLKINSLDEDFDPADLSFDLSDGSNIKWRFAQVNDELVSEKIIAETKVILKENGVIDEEIDIDMLREAYLIKTINGNELSLVDKYVYLTEIMGPTDFIRFLKKKSDKFQIGVETIINANCEKCGGQVEVPVMFSSEFFFPTYIA